MINIIEVQTASELEQLKELYHGHFQLLAQEYGLNISLQDIEEEVARWPGQFAPPEGRLIMAVTSEQAIGCAALRRIGEKVCELRRMFVLPQFHKQGVRHTLAKKLIEDARAIGYERMRLYTGSLLTDEIQTYESLGFQRIEPYAEVSEDLRKTSIFMELQLN